MLAITYTQAMHIRIHKQGRCNDYTAHSLYRILVMEPLLLGVMKREYIVPRAGSKPNSLEFQTSVLTISPPAAHAPTLLTPNCLCGFLPDESVQTIINCYLMLIISFTYIYSLGAIIIHCIPCTGSWSRPQCHGAIDDNWKYCA